MRINKRLAAYHFASGRPDLAAQLVAARHQRPRRPLVITLSSGSRHVMPRRSIVLINTLNAAEIDNPDVLPHSKYSVGTDINRGVVILFWKNAAAARAFGFKMVTECYFEDDALLDGLRFLSKDCMTAFRSGDIESIVLHGECFSLVECDQIISDEKLPA